ncbi:MAG: DUF4492 domain-containing protein [Paludibacter sp.]|nr:DUF4492 domain-containing protein [Paludibacter sp.]
MFKKLYLFYKEGFSNMTVGKTLWMIALIKLFIMFGILKVFFFPNQLKTNYDNDRDRSEHVIKQLIDRSDKEIVNQN